jgi:peptidoglycan/LPS O-acetylase OafA/YrhL
MWPEPEELAPLGLILYGGGVAWTLAIEVIFYTLCALFLPQPRLCPATSAAMCVLCLAVIVWSRSFGASFFLFAAARLLGERARPPRIVRLTADISYSLYLSAHSAWRS